MYVSLQDLEPLIPREHLSQALADDGQVPDARIFDRIAAAASADVDARLGGRYAVPFTGSVPAVAAEAARIFAAEMVYQRRGLSSDLNPFTKRAETMRLRLDSIGEGKLPLSAGIDRTQASASAVTSAAGTYSERLSV